MTGGTHKRMARYHNGAAAVVACSASRHMHGSDQGGWRSYDKGSPP